MDDELIRVCALATRVACQRMTPTHLKALRDSVEQACCLPARTAWDRKAGPARLDTRGGGSAGQHAEDAQNVDQAVLAPRG